MFFHNFLPTSQNEETENRKIFLLLRCLRRSFMPTEKLRKGKAGEYRSQNLILNSFPRL